MIAVASVSSISPMSFLMSSSWIGSSARTSDCLGMPFSFPCQALMGGRCVFTSPRAIFELSAQGREGITQSDVDVLIRRITRTGSTDHDLESRRPEVDADPIMLAFVL